MAQPIIRATEAEVVAIPEPEGTDTWNPVGHARIIAALSNVLEDKGVGVVNKHYTLAANGKQMFSTWVLDSNGDGRNHMIGFRNSIDTVFAVGFCSGLHVIVCSNGMLTGEFETFHRHTKGLTDDKLIDMATETYAVVQEKTARFAAWHDSLRPHYIDEDQAKVLTFDALRSGLIAPRRFNDFIQAFDAEREIEKDNPSLYTWHGGVTRMIRDENLFNVSNTNRDLIVFCDDYMARKAA